MKITNISKEEQKVLPHTGPSFSCAAGESVDVADVCAAELVASLPFVWALADRQVEPKTTKSMKEI